MTQTFEDAAIAWGKAQMPCYVAMENTAHLRGSSDCNAAVVRGWAGGRCPSCVIRNPLAETTST